MAKMQRGNIWWVAFDLSVGSEPKKTRPAIIVSNNIANRVSPRVQVIPITSKVKKIFEFEVPLTVEGRPAKAMADQITTIDKSRLVSFLAAAEKDTMVKVDRAVKLQLSLS